MDKDKVRRGMGGAHEGSPVELRSFLSLVNYVRGFKKKIFRAGGSTYRSVEEES